MGASLPCDLATLRLHRSDLLQLVMKVYTIPCSVILLYKVSGELKIGIAGAGGIGIVVMPDPVMIDLMSRTTYARAFGYPGAARVLQRLLARLRVVHSYYLSAELASEA